MAKKSKKFPQTIFAVREDPDNNGDYLIADPNIEAHALIGEETRVAVYELVEVREVTGVVSSRVV